LQQSLVMDPADVSARRRLAMLLANAKRYTEAVEQFEALRVLQPEDDAVVANLAVSYCFSGDTERALALLTPRVGDATVPFVLLKTRAQILQSVGRVQEAFDELVKARSDHWDDP